MYLCPLQLSCTYPFSSLSSACRIRLYIASNWQFQNIPSLFNHSTKWQNVELCLTGTGTFGDFCYSTTAQSSAPYPSYFLEAPGAARGAFRGPPAAARRSLPVPQIGAAPARCLPSSQIRTAQHSAPSFISLICAPSIRTEERIPLKNPFCGFFKLFRRFVQISLLVR